MQVLITTADDADTVDWIAIATSLTWWHGDWALDAPAGGVWNNAMVLQPHHRPGSRSSSPPAATMASLCDIFAPVRRRQRHHPRAAARSRPRPRTACSPGSPPAVSEAVTWIIGILASWTQIPSTPVCQSNAPLGSATMVTDCANSAWPSGQLQHWVLSITILIATFGVSGKASR